MWRQVDDHRPKGLYSTSTGTSSRNKVELFFFAPCLNQPEHCYLACAFSLTISPLNKITNMSLHPEFPGVFTDFSCVF